MKDQNKTKAQLSVELAQLRQRVAALEAARAEHELTEAALRESKKRYKALYSMVRLMCDNAPDLIWAKDLDRRFIFVNRAMGEKLLNASNTDEPIGKTDLYFAHRERAAHPDNPNWHTFGQICIDSDAAVMDVRQPERFDEFGYVQGQFLFLDVYKAPFWDEHGQMIGTVGCGRIVTKEKQQAQELALLDQVRTALAGQLDLPTVLRTIVEAIAGTFGYNQVSIYLLRGEILELQYQVGYDQVLAQIPITQGIAGRVIRTGQPILIKDVRTDPDFLGAIEGIVSEICVPLFDRGQVVGFFNIESTQGVTLTEADLRLILALGEQINLAISRARLYTAARESERRFRELAEKNAELYWETLKRLKEQTALRKTAALISSSLDLPTVLRLIAEQMGQAIDVTSAHICEHDQEITAGVVMAQYFSPEANPLERIFYQGLIYHLPQDLPSLLAFLRSDEPVHIFHMDDPELPEVERLQWEQSGLCSGLMIRLEFGSEILGSATLGESRRRRVFTIREIVLCQSIAQQAAIAIKHAHLYAETQQQLKEQTALLKAATVLSSTLDLPAVLNHIAEQMAQAIDATSAYLCSYKPKTLTSIVLAEYLSPQVNAAEHRSDLGLTYDLSGDLPGVLAFLQSDQVTCTEHEDDPHVPEADRSHLQYYGACSILRVKLQVGGEMVGYAVLWESRRRREFTPTEISLCQGIAQQAALAINNARLWEQARQDAETKTALLQEVNHRVKNNLATIIGLLYTERRHQLNTESQETLEAVIQDLINRVESLATVHSLLSSTGWAPLSLSELTEQVIDSARQGLSPAKQMFIEVSSVLIWITPQQASNLALIINELTINTIKYALRERQSVRVVVQLKQRDNTITLKFQNDGPGYPAEVLNFKQHNVGFYLIQNIVRKGLRGEVHLSNEPGPTVIIRFPISNDSAKYFDEVMITR